MSKNGFDFGDLDLSGIKKGLEYSNPFLIIFI